MTTATLEVLACNAFKQPIRQAEINRLFDAGLVVTFRDPNLVEEFAGADGRMRFATTQAFLQRFGRKLAGMDLCLSFDYCFSNYRTFNMSDLPDPASGAEAHHSEQKALQSNFASRDVERMRRRRPNPVLFLGRNQVRLVFVEDHLDTARLLWLLLACSSYAVKTAGDAAIALELAAQEPF